LRDRRPVLTAATTEEKLAQLEQGFAALTAERDQRLAERDQVTRERDEYKKLYVSLLEVCRKLERGIRGQQRERFTGGDSVTMSLLGMLTGDAAADAAPPPPTREEVAAHTRAKPTGRKPLPEKLPRVDITVLPPEVEKAGLDAFDRIGEDVSETVERRPSSFVVVRVHKPKFVLKGTDRVEEDCVVLQGGPPGLPIQRGLAGPGLLADTIVRRWQDHLPLHRLERIYGREGLPLARSTVCGWHAELAKLVKPLIDAMWTDAFTAPYLCTDATGVLVRDNEKCRRGHFWVLAAPEKHILFTYTPKHDGDAVDDFLKGYKGHLVCDAHSVYDHLFRTGDVIECACMSHARRYHFKALQTDPERAGRALTLLGALFKLERALATSTPEERRRVRQEKAKPVLEEYFAWCDREAELVLDETPISKAIGYSRNQRVALSRFLEDGRLPMHNNLSERELRREAVGRRNWIFLGSDDGGEVNATFVTLLASCQLHGLEPLGYLRDLFCLLPSWPAKRVIELAPAYWQQTLQQEDAQQRFATNLFRQVSLGALVEHCPEK
jgi:transposase